MFRPQWILAAEALLLDEWHILQDLE